MLKTSCAGNISQSVNVLFHHNRRHLLQSTCTNRTNKPVGDWISAPSPNFVAMATRVGPRTFCTVPLNRPSPKTPWQAQTSPVYLPYKPTSTLCTKRQFCANFGEQIVGVRGLNQIQKKQFCRESLGELTAKNGLILSRNKQEEATDRQTSGQTESIVDNNRLLGWARRSISCYTGQHFTKEQSSIMKSNYVRMHMLQILMLTTVKNSGNRCRKMVVIK